MSSSSLKLDLSAAEMKEVDEVVDKLKKQGLFDRFRKECLADVDTKPAYQNLWHRVEGAVAKFLGQHQWRPDLNKNHLRDQLRKHITELPMLTIGVNRVVEQVVNPKIYKDFKPDIDKTVCDYFGISYETWQKKQEMKEEIKRRREEQRQLEARQKLEQQSANIDLNSSFEATQSPHFPVGSPGFGSPPPSSLGVPGIGSHIPASQPLQAGVQSDGILDSSQQSTANTTTPQPNLVSGPPVPPVPPFGVPNALYGFGPGQTLPGLNPLNPSAGIFPGGFPPSMLQAGFPHMPNMPGIPGYPMPGMGGIAGINPLGTPLTPEAMLAQARATLALQQQAAEKDQEQQTGTEKPADTKEKHKRKDKKKKIEPLTVEDLLNIPLPKPAPASNKTKDEKDVSVKKEDVDIKQEGEEFLETEIVDSGEAVIGEEVMTETVIVQDSTMQNDADGQPVKVYHFAWDNIQSDVDLSDVSVSSVHTSDISDFEDDDDESIFKGSAPSTDNEATQEKEQEGEEIKISVIKTTSESTITTTTESELDTTACTDIPVTSSPEKSTAPEATVAQENIQQPSKPRKLLSLRYNYSDSENEETREERRERMAREKEERYRRRLERRADIEARRIKREEEKLKKKTQVKEDDEKQEKSTEESREESQAEPSQEKEENGVPIEENTEEDKVVTTTGIEEDVQTVVTENTEQDEKETKPASPESPLKTSSVTESPIRSPEKKGRGRRSKQVLKEQLREQKVLEKRMALRSHRQRVRNRKYLSEDFTSIFTENKQLLSGDSYVEVVDAVESVEVVGDNMEVAPDYTQGIQLDDIKSPPTPTQDEQFTYTTGITDESQDGTIPVVEVVATVTPTLQSAGLSGLSKGLEAVTSSSGMEGQSTEERTDEEESGSQPGTPYSEISSDSLDAEPQTKKQSVETDSSKERADQDNTHKTKRYDDSELYKPRHSYSRRLVSEHAEEPEPGERSPTPPGESPEPFPPERRASSESPARRRSDSSDYNQRRRSRSRSRSHSSESDSAHRRRHSRSTSTSSFSSYDSQNPDHQRRKRKRKKTSRKSSSSPDDEDNDYDSISSSSSSEHSSRSRKRRRPRSSSPQGRADLLPSERLFKDIRDKDSDESGPESGSDDDRRKRPSLKGVSFGEAGRRASEYRKAERDKIDFGEAARAAEAQRRWHHGSPRGMGFRPPMDAPFPPGRPRRVHPSSQGARLPGPPGRHALPQKGYSFKPWGKSRRDFPHDDPPQPYVRSSVRDDEWRRGGAMSPSPDIHHSQSPGVAGKYRDVGPEGPLHGKLPSPNKYERQRSGLISDSPDLSTSQRSLSPESMRLSQSPGRSRSPSSPTRQGWSDRESYPEHPAWAPGSAMLPVTTRRVREGHLHHDSPSPPPVQRRLREGGPSSPPVVPTIGGLPIRDAPTPDLPPRKRPQRDFSEVAVEHERSPGPPSEGEWSDVDMAETGCTTRAQRKNSDIESLPPAKRLRSSYK